MLDDDFLRCQEMGNWRQDFMGPTLFRFPPFIDTELPYTLRTVILIEALLTAVMWRLCIFQCQPEAESDIVCCAEN